jgi:hypothetical protein
MAMGGILTRPRNPHNVHLLTPNQRLSDRLAGIVRAVAIENHDVAVKFVHRFDEFVDGAGGLVDDFNRVLPPVLRAPDQGGEDVPKGIGLGEG